MICDKQVCHKILVLLLLTLEDYSTALMENHDVRCDNQHSMKEYLKDHNSCKFPVEVQQENVPVSILHQADEVRLKRRERKPNREMQSIQSNKLLMHQQQRQQSSL